MQVNLKLRAHWQMRAQPLAAAAEWWYSGDAAAAGAAAEPLARRAAPRSLATPILAVVVVESRYHTVARLRAEACHRTVGQIDARDGRLVETTPWQAAR